MDQEPSLKTADCFERNRMLISTYWFVWFFPSVLSFSCSSPPPIPVNYCFSFWLNTTWSYTALISLSSMLYTFHNWFTGLTYFSHLKDIIIEVMMGLTCGRLKLQRTSNCFQHSLIPFLSIFIDTEVMHRICVIHPMHVHCLYLQTHL